MRTAGDHRPPATRRSWRWKLPKSGSRWLKKKWKPWPLCAFVRHEIDEFDGRRGGLQRYIETDFAKTIATLERMILAIEAYAEIESAAEEPAPPPVTNP